MRKGELFRSSAEFLFGGVLAIVGYFIMLKVEPLADPGLRGTVLGWVIGLTMIALLIVGGMGLLGALLMFVRACFQSRTYDPHQVWLTDEPKSDEGKR
jgi:hypothetical protein